MCELESRSRRRFSINFSFKNDIFDFIKKIKIKNTYSKNKKQTFNLSKKSILFLETPMGAVSYLESSEVNES